MDTTYGKIETLFERDMVKGSPTEHKLLEPLRFKNSIYEQLAKMDWTEKIDGTNIRVDWTPSKLEGPTGQQEREPESLRYGGKTDRARLPGQLVKWLEVNLSVDIMRKRFETATVTLYGEGYGAGIQKGGGYRLDQAFILFDVFVHDPKYVPTLVTPSNADEHWIQGYWMTHETVEEVGATLGIEVVPSFGSHTIMEAAEFVRKGFYSTVAGWHGNHKMEAEGLVGRPRHTMFGSRGNRIIAKLKTKDFLKRDIVPKMIRPVDYNPDHEIHSELNYE